MRSWGSPPTGENAKYPDLRNVEVLEINDPLAEQHWTLLEHHPGFQAELPVLREELEAAYEEPVTSDFLADLVANPQSAPYPILKAAEEWGVSPIVLIGLVLESTEDWIEHFRPRANGIFIWETPGEFMVRIPRPITPEKRKELDEWLKHAPEGQLERAYDLIGRSRHDQSPSLLKTLPWFKSWNEGEEPAKIWRDVRDNWRDTDNEKVPPTFEQFHGRLVRTWERMRAISPKGIRDKRPSKAPA